MHIKNIDAVIATEAARYIGASGPDLSWVYLQYPDDVGHLFGDSSEFTAAVEFADRQVGLIWASIERRQKTHAEDWLVIVTTDHGRDAETGKDHGGQTERERSIWIATNSQRLNGNFAQHPSIVDILPSVATHLGLEIPTDIAARLDGESFID